MAKKDIETVVDSTIDSDEETQTAERRRQSPLTRLKFCLNNLVMAAINGGLTDVPEVVAAENLLADIGFELRESTAITAGKISQAMMSLDPMNDLTPRRIKKLSQLLAKAQKGDLITDEQIEEAAGGEIEFEYEELQSEDIADAGEESSVEETFSEDQEA